MQLMTVKIHYWWRTKTYQCVEATVEVPGPHSQARLNLLLEDGRRLYIPQIDRVHYEVIHPDGTSTVASTHW